LYIVVTNIFVYFVKPRHACLLHDKQKVNIHENLYK
jgi:hypothetical protein